MNKMLSVIKTLGIIGLFYGYHVSCEGPTDGNPSTQSYFDASASVDFSSFRNWGGSGDFSFDPDTYYQATINVSLQFSGPKSDNAGPAVIIRPGQSLASILSNINIKVILNNGTISVDDTTDSALSSVFVYLTRPLVPQPLPGQTAVDGPLGEQLWSPETVYIGEHSLQGMKTGDVKTLTFENYALNFDNEPALCGEALLVWRFDPLGTSKDIGGPSRTMAINVTVNCSDVVSQTKQFVEIIPDYQAGGQRAAVLVYSGGRLRKSLAYMGYPNDEWTDMFAAPPAIMSYVGRMRLLIGRERRSSRVRAGDSCRYDSSLSKLNYDDLSQFADFLEGAISQFNSTGTSSTEKPRVRRQAPGGVNVGLRPGSLVNAYLATNRVAQSTQAAPNTPDDDHFSSPNPQPSSDYTTPFPFDSSTIQDGNAPFDNWNNSGDSQFQNWNTMADLPDELKAIVRFLRILANKDDRLNGVFFQKMSDSNLQTQIVRVAKGLSDLSKRREAFLGVFSEDNGLTCPGSWAGKLINFLRDMSQYIASLRFPVKDKTASSALSKTDNAPSRVFCWIAQNIDGSDNDLLTLNDGVVEWHRRIGLDKVIKAAMTQNQIQIMQSVDVSNSFNFDMASGSGSVNMDDFSRGETTPSRSKREADAASTPGQSGDNGDTIGFGDTDGSGSLLDPISLQQIAQIAPGDSQDADPCYLNSQQLLLQASPFTMFWTERYGKIYQGVRSPWSDQNDRKINWRVVASLQCSGTCDVNVADDWQSAEDPLLNLYDDGDDSTGTTQAPAGDSIVSLFRDVVGVRTQGTIGGMAGQFTGSTRQPSSGGSHPQPPTNGNNNGHNFDDFESDNTVDWSWQSNGNGGIGSGGNFQMNYQGGQANVGQGSAGFNVNNQQQGGKGNAGQNGQFNVNSQQQGGMGSQGSGGQNQQQFNNNNNGGQQQNYQQNSNNVQQGQQHQQSSSTWTRTSTTYNINYYGNSGSYARYHSYGYQRPYYSSYSSYYAPSVSPLGLIASALLFGAASSSTYYYSSPTYYSSRAYYASSYPRVAVVQPSYAYYRPAVQTSYYSSYPSYGQTFNQPSMAGTYQTSSYYQQRPTYYQNGQSAQSYSNYYGQQRAQYQTGYQQPSAYGATGYSQNGYGTYGGAASYGGANNWNQASSSANRGQQQSANTYGWNTRQGQQTGGSFSSSNVGYGQTYGGSSVNVNNNRNTGNVNVFTSNNNNNRQGASGGYQASSFGVSGSSNTRTGNAAVFTSNSNSNNRQQGSGAVSGSGGTVRCSGLSCNTNAGSGTSRQGGTGNNNRPSSASGSVSFSSSNNRQTGSVNVFSSDNRPASASSSRSSSSGASNNRPAGLIGSNSNNNNNRPSSGTSNNRPSVSVISSNSNNNRPSSSSSGSSSSNNRPSLSSSSSNNRPSVSVFTSSGGSSNNRPSSSYSSSSSNNRPSGSVSVFTSSGSSSNNRPSSSYSSSSNSRPSSGSVSSSSSRSSGSSSSGLFSSGSSRSGGSSSSSRSSSSSSRSSGSSSGSRRSRSR